MSTEKQFEKAITRRKDKSKSNDNNKKKVIEDKGKKRKSPPPPSQADLVAPSSSAESQQQQQPKKKAKKKIGTDIKPNSKVYGKINGPTTGSSSSKQKVKVNAKPQKVDNKKKVNNVASSKQKQKQQKQEKQNENKQPPEKKKKQPEKKNEKAKRVIENGDIDNKVKKKKQNNNINKKEKQTDNGNKMRIDESETAETADCSFPINRISKIIRSEGSDYRITQEATFLINKATEKFLEAFCEDSYDYVVWDRRNAVAYKHLSTVVSKEERFDFLSDVVPQKVRAEKALAKRKTSEQSGAAS